MVQGVPLGKQVYVSVMSLVFAFRGIEDCIWCAFNNNKLLLAHQFWTLATINIVMTTDICVKITS